MKPLFFLKLKKLAFFFLPAILSAAAVVFIILVVADFFRIEDFYTVFVGFFASVYVFCTVCQICIDRVSQFRCFAPPRIIRQYNCPKPHITMPLHHLVYRFMLEFRVYTLADWQQNKDQNSATNIDTQLETDRSIFQRFMDWVGI